MAFHTNQHKPGRTTMTVSRETKIARLQATFPLLDPEAVASILDKLDAPEILGPPASNFAIYRAVYNCGSWASRQRWHDWREARSWALAVNAENPDSTVRVFKYICREPVEVPL